MPDDSGSPQTGEPGGPGGPEEPISYNAPEGSFKYDSTEGSMYEFVSQAWVLYTPSDGTVVQDYTSEDYYKYSSGSWSIYTPSDGDIALREDGNKYQYNSQTATWTRYYDYDETHLVRYKDLREIVSRLITRIEALEA